MVGVTGQHDESDHSPVRVRAAIVGDAPAIGAIHVRSWEGAYRGMVPDAALDARSVARQTEVWEGLLTQCSPGGLAADRLWVLVAVTAPGPGPETGTPTGFVSVNGPSRDEDGTPQTAEISALYVDPTAWRRGAGTALMDAALAETAQRGFTTATLWVLEPNARARGFYERCGFTDDGGRQTAEPGWPDEIRMRRAI